MKALRLIFVSAFAASSLLVSNFVGLQTKAISASTGSGQAGIPIPETHSISYQAQPAKKAAFERGTTMRANLAHLSREVVGTGRIALPLDGTSKVISLVPNEVRTSDFGAFVDRGGKLVPVEAGPCRTYRGTIEGISGSEVRLYLDDSYLGGTITTPTESYTIDTIARDTIAKNGVSSEVATVVLGKADAKVCLPCQAANRFLNGSMAKGAGRVQIDPAMLPGQPIVNRTIAQRVVKIVTDCDFEYVQVQGGASNANARLLSFINTIDPFFQQGIGVRLRVSGQVARDTLPQVYTGTSTQMLYSQLASDWVNRPTPSRAFVMMLSGKTFAPLSDAGTGSGASCANNQGFVAREGNPSSFGQFATINLLSLSVTEQMNLEQTVIAGDPDCGGDFLANFIGQLPLNGDSMATEFCWKTVRGVNLALSNPVLSCIASSPESTLTIVNSTSRMVSSNGGTVNMTIQGPTTGDFQAYSRESWMSTQFNSTSGILTITVNPIGKGSNPNRFGTVVINGTPVTISQQ